MQSLALLIVLASVPCAALLAGKILDFTSESQTNIFTKLSFPLAAVVALHSPIFPDALAKALEVSASVDTVSVLLRAISAAGIFAGVVAALLTLFVLAAEIPFRWGAEKIFTNFSALRPCALLFLLSVSFYLIVDWGEVIFSSYFNG